MAIKAIKSEEVTRQHTCMCAIMIMLMTLTPARSDGVINITIDGRITAQSRSSRPDQNQHKQSEQAKMINKAIALLTKFSPGMTYDDTVKLLDSAATSNLVGGDKDLVRKCWLHGEFGVEIYFLKERSYRIDIISQFENETDVLHALNDILQHGRKKYKSMPKWDSVAGEHYWVESNMKFGYARLGRCSLDVRVSRKAII